MLKLVNSLNTGRLLVYRSFNTRPLCSSFAVVAIAMAFFLLFIRPKFDTNDDVSMMFSVNGYHYDQPSEYLIFTQVIIGLILKFLYTVIPHISWYAIYLYSFHLIACSLILYTLLLVKKDNIQFLLSIYTLALFEIIMITNLQFTSTSLLLGISSIFYYLIIAREKKSNYWVPIIAGVLLGTAGVIRSNSFFGTLIFSFPLLVYGAKSIPWRKTIVFILSALCVFWCSSVTNSLYYSFDPAWSSYLEFNQIRGSLHGTPKLDLKLDFNDKVKSILNKINWSENDYYMFASWFYTDRKRFSVDAIKILAKEINLTKKTEKMPSEFTFFTQSYRGKIILVLLGLSVFFAFNLTKKKVLFISILVIWHFLIVFYLVSYLRFPLRVSLPSFLFLSLSLLLFSKVYFPFLLPRKILLKIKPIIISFVLLVCVLAPAHEILSESRNNVTKHQEIISVLETLKQVNPEGIFVVWGKAIKYEDISPFVTSKDIPKLKLIGLGWRINSPPHLDLLKKLKIDDLYEAIATRNDLYLITREDYVKLYEKYMSEHYGKVVKLKSILTIDNSDSTLSRSKKIKVFHNYS